jgi:orotidine-5'-phosphate decarboxylase
MHFTKKFKKTLRDTNSHLIVGLDTDLSKIPQFLKTTVNPIAEFNRIIVNATKEYCCGYKLNIAFYEKEIEIGWAAIQSTLALIGENHITIADAKRGDMENTAEQYAQAYFDMFGFDSITVQPYMGQDAARPFLRRKNKFVWMLALTSNYGSNDFQFLKIGQKPLYQVVIEKSLSWNDHKIGFVIGANHTDELKKITKTYPEVPILIPGIGAQKNSLEKLVSVLSHNLFVINQSRSIIYTAPKAQNEKELAEAVTQSAKAANDEINLLLEQKKIKK